MSEQGGEKSFDPTEKRIREATEKGDVIRSREMATAGAITVGAAWLLLAAPDSPGTAPTSKAFPPAAC